jgi:hypothetical protein
MINKMYYFIRMALKILDKKICPYCLEENYEIIEKKYFVTSLLKCKTCYLNYKHPADSKEFFTKHYQKDYKTIHSYMSDLPSEYILNELIEKNFPDNRSYKKYFDALPFKINNRENIKIFEFGASWGYNIFKLVKEGYDAAGYELSVPRSNFGQENLKINLINNTYKIRNNNDIFFSNHVIEHLSDIKEFINLAKMKLSNEGFFVAFCPNGAKEYKSREPNVYKLTWGFEHPNLLDYEFASYLFKDNPHLILTGDWNFDEKLISEWDGLSQKIGLKKDGKELLIISMPNKKFNKINN